MDDAELRKQMREIHADTTLSEKEKGLKCQALMSARWASSQKDAEDQPQSPAAKREEKKQNILDDDALKCVFCSSLCVRPVTAPCQHNFCLGCFGKWCAQGKKECPTCRAKLPAAFISNPRINTALTVAIRMARQGDRTASRVELARIANADRPEEAFTTERAVRAGRANASSGRIMVTVPADHFGPIPAEADPRGQGIRVGEWWKDRLDCRQWGAHRPHVAGIAGQSDVGAQSVVLSGGYEDDKDEGEWFLYTGSGGRDLSGNKRTSKVQSFDQEFESSGNKALKTSCKKGLPVRVVRSFKEKRSSYAPSTDTPVRYDGVYRIAACWRKDGAQGKLVCRYLFIRCDNEPAPWSSDETGDKPVKKLPAEAVKEMKQAKGAVFHMSDDPWWGWDEEGEQWKWTRAPPISKCSGEEDESNPKVKRKQISKAERALKEFACGSCKGILEQPVSMPCSHVFCKPCLQNKFDAMGEVEEAKHGRAMRVRYVVKPCPVCKADLAPYLRTYQVNVEMAAVIAKLQAAAQAARDGDAETAAAETAAAEATAAGAGIKTTTMEAADGAADGAAVDEAAEQQDGSDAQGPSDPDPAAAAAPAAGSSAAVRPSDADMLAAEFEEFDAGLIASLLEDQGGDIKEVRFYLQKMQNAAKAAEKKASKAGRAANGSKPEKGKAAVAEAAVEDAAAAADGSAANGTAETEDRAASGSAAAEEEATEAVAAAAATNGKVSGKRKGVAAQGRTREKKQKT